MPSRSIEEPPELQEAIQLYEAQRFPEARLLLMTIIERYPEFIRAFRLLARVEEYLGNVSRATQLLDQALEIAPEDAPTLYFRGVLAQRTDPQQVSLAAEAQHYLERAIAADPTMAEAHFQAGIAVQVQTREVEAIPYFLAAVAIAPDMVKAHYELAKAYNTDGRYEEAKHALRTVIRLDETHAAARKDLEDLSQPVTRPKRGQDYARFPHDLSMFQDVKEAVREFILGTEYPVILDRASRIATFGSCFAGNIARALREIGVDARNTTFGESINSTPANRQYVEWVVDGVENEATRAIAHFHAGDPNFSMDREEHFRRFAEADIILLTVGVAPCFFDRSDGSLVVPRPSSFGFRALLRRCEFRTTTVMENVDNIQHIIENIRRINSNCSIIITVSPVPLTATFEFKSAIIADCVSKSTLRVAVDEVMRLKLDKVLYWPSFEVVRWLGPYVPGMYGQDDGSTIHVSESVIAMQMELFIDVLSGGAISG